MLNGLLYGFYGFYFICKSLTAIVVYDPNSNLLPWMRLKCLEFMRKANLREGERISIEGRSDEKDSNEKVSIKVDGGRVSR